MLGGELQGSIAGRCADLLCLHVSSLACIALAPYAGVPASQPSSGGLPLPRQAVSPIQLLLVQMQGGGNCGNALTAVARMGVHAALVSKIGTDGISEQILAEFERDGVDTQQVLRAKGPSPFTYIIVDRAGALGDWWSTLSWSRFMVCQCLLTALPGAW